MPRLVAALLLSVLIHAAALWVSPQAPLRPAEIGDDPARRSALNLRLVPRSLPAAPAEPPPALSSPPSPSRPPSPPAPKTEPAPPKPQPPVPAPKPAPVAPVPAPVAPPVPPPAMTGDLASYIEARRRNRPEAPPAPPTENQDERRRRIIEGNIGSSRDQAFGYDPKKTGGMFNIEQMGSDYAEFTYNGWRSDIGRNTRQLISVHRGGNPDIRIAVVRRMITIIRDNTQGEFLWVSQRLGRGVMLSANPRDNSGLEEFLMLDFFHQVAPAQR